MFPRSLALAVSLSRGQLELPVHSDHSARESVCTPTTMKLLQAVTAALLPFSVLAAKKPSSQQDRFSTYNQQQLSAAGPVKLNDKSYNDLTKAPRDYSVAVLLTALEARFGCNLCNEFQPEWELLAKQWSRGDKSGEGRLVFGTLDFGDGKSTFQSVCTTILYDTEGLGC